MKKYSIIALILLLTLSLSACGMRDKSPDSGITILPSMDPTIGTNIPDPNVDTKMPIYTDGTDMGEWTDPTETQIATNDQAEPNN